MPTKPVKKPRPENRPMPEDPHDLARAMFQYGDKKMKEKRETEEAPAQRRRVRLSIKDEIP